MADYKLSQTALVRLGEIYEYSLLNFGERRADTFYLVLHDTFRKLAEFPSLGRPFHEYRRHDHGQYAIFYELIDGGIMITHVYHHSEDIDSKLG